MNKNEKKKIDNDESIAEFEKLSAERKYLTSIGEVPEFYITQGLRMFQEKYAHNGESVRGAYERMSNHFSKYVPHLPEAKDKFFNLMWKGNLAPATPVYNGGTDRGHSVSCSGSYIYDSIKGFYSTNLEIAMLSKTGYGTSCYLDDIRPRGSDISIGGKADGVLPVLEMVIETTSRVNQGNNRRGQIASYMSVDHPDFWEIAGFVLKNHTKTNIGWIFRDDFIEKLKLCDKEAIKRWNRVLYLRARTGKGYIWKQDVANRLAPEPIRNCGIPIMASNLCTEIALPQNSEYSFSCVLSSLNLANWDDFDDDTIYWATIFLDCVVEDTIEKTADEPVFERIHNFTRDFRAIGLGALGFHSLLQKKGIPFESLEAGYLNNTIFKRIDEESKRASMDLARKLGEPKFCKGYGVRNATRIAVAPNTSSALLCGGMSQGIEPYVSNTYVQNLSCGEVTRMNPLLVQLLKDKGHYSIELMRDININHSGSVQHLKKQLTDYERLLYRSAFEMSQFVLIRLASQRQRWIDQAQSLNTFHGIDEKYIARVTMEALLDPRLKSLYYLRSLRGIRASKGDETECVACEG